MSDDNLLRLFGGLLADGIVARRLTRDEKAVVLFFVVIGLCAGLYWVELMRGSY